MGRKRKKRWRRRDEKRIHDLRRRILLRELEMLEKELEVLEAETYSRAAETQMISENLNRDPIRLRRNSYVV